MKPKQIFLLVFWATIAACRPLVAQTELPQATETAVSALPTNTPIPTMTPEPTLTPTPVAESQWQCYQGGVACYNNLFSISMLNSEDGWAQGTLRYTTSRNGESVWHLSNNIGIGVSRISTIGPDEWWGIRGGVLLHYKNGEIIEGSAFPEGVTGFFDLAVVASDDVWAVGEAGALIHHFQGNIERVDISEKYDIQTIAMLNAAEGWAAGTILSDYWSTGPGNIILHYKDGTWTSMPLHPEIDTLILCKIGKYVQNRGVSIGNHRKI